MVINQLLTNPDIMHRRNQIDAQMTLMFLGRIIDPTKLLVIKTQFFSFSKGLFSGLMMEKALYGLGHSYGYRRY